MVLPFDDGDWDRLRYIGATRLLCAFEITQLIDCYHVAGKGALMIRGLAVALGKRMSRLFLIHLVFAVSPV